MVELRINRKLTIDSTGELTSDLKRAGLFSIEEANRLLDDLRDAGLLSHYEMIEKNPRSDSNLIKVARKLLSVDEVTKSSIVKLIGINESTLYRKINPGDNLKFTVKDARKVIAAYREIIKKIQDVMEGM